MKRAGDCRPLVSTNLERAIQQLNIGSDCIASERRRQRLKKIKKKGSPMPWRPAGHRWSDSFEKQVLLLLSQPKFMADAALFAAISEFIR